MKIKSNVWDNAVLFSALYSGCPLICSAKDSFPQKWPTWVSHAVTYNLNQLKNVSFVIMCSLLENILLQWATEPRFIVGQKRKIGHESVAVEVKLKVDIFWNPEIILGHQGGCTGTQGPAPLWGSREQSPPLHKSNRFCFIDQNGVPLLIAGKWHQLQTFFFFSFTKVSGDNMLSVKSWNFLVDHS